MHFRNRSHVVQVIRTRYDPATKKPRAEIVARLPKGISVLPDDVRANCRPEEVEEIENWIAGEMRAAVVAAEHAARSLAEHIDKAGEWFAATDDADSARALAVRIQHHWAQLRKQLHRRGLLD